MGAGCIGYTGRMIDKRTTQVEKADRLIGNSGWVLLKRYSADLTAYPDTDVSDITFTVPDPSRGYKVFHITYTEYKPVTNEKALMIDVDVGGGYTDAYLGDAKWYFGHSESGSGAGWNSGNSGSSASSPGGDVGNAQQAMKSGYTGSSNGCIRFMFIRAVTHILRILLTIIILTTSVQPQQLLSKAVVGTGMKQGIQLQR